MALSQSDAGLLDVKTNLMVSLYVILAIHYFLENKFLFALSAIIAAIAKVTHNHYVYFFAAACEFQQPIAMVGYTLAGFGKADAATVVLALFYTMLGFRHENVAATAVGVGLVL
jgi:hypothetical protein